MKVTIYSHPAASIELVTALSDGFRAVGDDVSVVVEGQRHERMIEGTQMAVFLGLKNYPLYDLYLRAGKNVLLVDAGYLAPKRYYRFGLDGFHSRFLFNKSSFSVGNDRLDKVLADAGLTMKQTPDWKMRRKVLYMGMSQEYCDWHRLGVNYDYDSQQIRGIVAGLSDNRNTVWWKHKWPTGTLLSQVYWPRRTEFPSDGASIEQLLAQARVVYSHGSRLLVRAVVEGIPVITNTKKNFSAVASIAEAEKFAENPKRLPSFEERRSVLAKIAWAQFTLEEIQSGFAMKSLESFTIKRLEKFATGDPDDMRYLNEQYRLMHESGKYRGGLEDDLDDWMYELCNHHKAKRILDYGSGKGRQYLEFCQHLNWGEGIKIPTCYDPGYEPYSTKPTGTFDGVLCTDVAEHIPTKHIDWFLKDVLDYGTKFALFCIFTAPANKTLPDGRNAHLTVQPPEWWLERIAKAMGGKDYATFTWDTTDTLSEIPDTFRIQRNGKDVVVVFRFKE